MTSVLTCNFSFHNPSLGIHETPEAGPGDCHIKGGYIEGTKTWTVKLANVSFYKNIAKGLPAGSGIFVVCDATNGAPLAIFQENRYLTDLRTGAAGALSGLSSHTSCSYRNQMTLSTIDLCSPILILHK